MKDPVRIIQCARGGTIDEEALYEAIVSGKVAGAALDVFTDEDHPDSFKGLVLLDQVIASPHVGASTIEAQARVGREVAELAISFYRKRFATGQLQ
jgi:D-3-phosphoglycerate dehydrogenase